MFSHDVFDATLPENYMDWRNMPTASPNRRFELLPLVTALRFKGAVGIRFLRRSDGPGMAR